MTNNNYTVSSESSLWRGDVWEWTVHWSGSHRNVKPLKRKGHFTPCIQAEPFMCSEMREVPDETSLCTTSLHALDQSIGPSSSTDGELGFLQYTTRYLLLFNVMLLQLQQSCHFEGLKISLGKLMWGHRDRVDEAYHILSSHPCSPSPRGSHLYFSGENKETKKKHRCNEGFCLGQVTFIHDGPLIASRGPSSSKMAPSRLFCSSSLCNTNYCQ